MTLWLMDSRLFIIPPILSITIGLVLASLSLFRSQRNIENILFIVVCVWWSLLAPIFISHHLTKDMDLLLRIDRCIHFFYVFNPPINILFFHHILSINRRRLIAFAFAVSFLFALCTPFPIYFNGLYEFSWGYIARGKIMFQLFGGYCIISVTYCAALLIRRIRIENNSELRKKYYYMLLSFGTASILTALNLPATNGYNFYPPGNFVFIPLSILAYGVLRYQLMDIRSILHQTFFWLLLSSLILLPNIFIFRFLFVHITSLPAPILFGLFVLWFVANAIYFHYVQPWIDRRFNRKAYDLCQIEMEFIANIASLKNLDALVREFCVVLKEALSLKHIDILFFASPPSCFQTLNGTIYEFPRDFIQWLKKHHGLLDQHIVDIAPDFTDVRKAVKNCLEPVKSRYLLPFFQEDDLTIIARLSEKINFRPLSHNEILFLNRIATASSIAFSNSLLFQNISNLKEDIERHTANLAREIKERQWTEEQLRISDDKYRTVLESIEDGYYEVSLEGNLTFFNAALGRILGYTLEELNGMNYRRFVAAMDHRNMVHTFQKVLKSGHSAKAVDWELIRKDGSKRPIQLSITLIRDTDGRTVGFRGIARDVFDLKQAETERRRLENRLQNAGKMEAIGLLAGKVAHDLNNILSGLVSYPDLLLMDLTRDDPLRKPLLAIKDSGEKASAIVQDLLTLTRRSVTVTKVISLNRIVETFLDSPELHTLIKQQPNITITPQLDSELLSISGSPFHLSKTLMNLVSNAVEAMPAGGSVIIRTNSVNVDRPLKGYETVKEGDYATLEVTDTGIGIAKSDLELIFQPFYTKKAMGKSGTGLGMAVIWGTVKDHRGYLEVRSVEGEGTTFILYFPVTRKTADIKEKHLNIEDYLGRGETILVVDDICEQRDIATNMLEKLGYVVSAVDSGEAAIAYLEKRCVDLVILDMIMEPGIDGLKTYRLICEYCKDQRAIIASGYSETNRVREAQRLGAGTYVKKPYTLEKIGMAVRSELDRHRSNIVLTKNTKNQPKK
jgi:PAS domain S-box-containing protein